MKHTFNLIFLGSVHYRNINRLNAYIAQSRNIKMSVLQMDKTTEGLVRRSSVTYWAL